MAERTSDYDALVVGSGFAGSWAAKELTEAGLRVLMLEAGPGREAAEVPERFPPRRPVPSVAARSPGPAMPRGASRPAPMLDGTPLEAGDPLPDTPGQHVQREHSGFTARGPHLFVDDDERPYETPPDASYQWIRGMQVGGRSLTWGGTALRFSPYELDAPALDGCDLAWPIAYRDLAPWYAAVERTMGICGSAEGLPQLPDNEFRHEPYASTPAERKFQRRYRAPGTRPIPVRFIPQDSGENGWPGFTMQATALAAAHRTGRLDLRTGATVVEVTVDERRRATGVRYALGGERRQATARVVFLGCGTVESTRLLLASRSARHPAGIGNSSGWLGRGLMDHPVFAASGILTGHSPVTGYEWSARQRGLMVAPPIGPAGDTRPFGLWVTLQRRDEDGVPTGNIDAQGEMLPYRHNRVRLGDRRDRWGVPVPVIECSYGPHEERLYAAMRQAVAEAAAVAGLRLTAVASELTRPGLNVHDLGTARMGARPDSSVLDPHNRCWDCTNLYVTDGSSFPGGGWQNPTLTIMALSARAGRHAARLLREGVY